MVDLKSAHKSESKIVLHQKNRQIFSDLKQIALRHGANGQRANARDVSFKSLYGDRFILSTHDQLKNPEFCVFTSPLTKG